MKRQELVDLAHAAWGDRTYDLINGWDDFEDMLVRYGESVAQHAGIEAQIAFAKHMYDVACLQSIPPKGETK
jgi:hypothetical protein